MNTFRYFLVIIFLFFIFAFFLLWKMCFNVGGTPYLSTCNLRIQQIDLALDRYYLEHGQTVPSCLYDDEGKPVHSWRVLILPFIGEKELYNQYNFSEPWNSPNNIKLCDRMPAIFRCPSMKFSTSCPSYLFAISENDNPADKNDNLKQKYLLIETNNNSINWLEPHDFPADNFKYGYSRGHKNDQKLCRLTSHRLRMSNDKLIHVTAASKKSTCFLITEDSDPEALKQLATENGEAKVSVIYPNKDDTYLRQIILKKP